MYLLRTRVKGIGPFDDIELGFDADGEPRPLTVVHGGGGVGKTSLLMAIANTRPGNSVLSSGITSEREQTGTVICEFYLGQDDPERPHPLVVASPNARVHADEALEILRRKEQALFDRVAREAGFVFVHIPASRWFSRQPITVSARGMARYDVRSTATHEDPARADLSREVKQILAYGTLTSALAGEPRTTNRFTVLVSALEQAVNTALALVGIRWIGLDPLSLEPIFRCEDTRVSSFDQLPTRARHLIAFTAIPVRALWAAFPHRDPRDAEGIVAIDEIDMHQDPVVQARVTSALVAALPKVQWIVTATSPIVASNCDARDVIALRRAPEEAAIRGYTGDLARIH